MKINDYTLLCEKNNVIIKKFLDEKIITDEVSRSKAYNIAKKVKSINSDEELKKYISDLAPNEEDKQTILLILQKIYKLDFYLRNL